MSSTLQIESASPRRPRRYGLARWWLAGLLVSCLLPASLHPSDALRSSDRGVCICFWMPAMLRAQSHWIAKKRRALRRWFHRQTRRAPQAPRRPLSFLPFALPLVAARDVVTPRGPPAR
ncbi:MAG TPA: hypothetical protein DDZ92_12820 [Halomonas sp.]|uniref:Uncharacterized protein n=1 Tax=Vreelandella aquamarina TaxID=77097 RepID=A0A857GLS8_9GAMM|nr:hypothetical protein [Halomonas sp.]QHD50243.1 hypothetical protein CTT34_11330 [Halomonas meridiana]HAZ98705.1 hypothetical protein [Halomonas sp.]HBM29737.1 hypothetical protein [Halomonas sp.]